MIILRSELNVATFQIVWTLRSSVWDVFNNFLLIDATDRTKTSSDQKRLFFAVSLYLLSFFANTPFNSFLSIPQFHGSHLIFLCILTVLELYCNVNEIEFISFLSQSIEEAKLVLIQLCANIYFSFFKCA